VGPLIKRAAVSGNAADAVWVSARLLFHGRVANLASHLGLHLGNITFANGNVSS